MAISKSRLRLYRSLHHPKGRREQGLFLVEGPELIREALQEGWPLDEVVLTSTLRQNRGDARKLIPLLELANVPHHFCSQSEMSRMADAMTPQGAIALGKYPVVLPEGGEVPEVLLVAECVSDPGNLGAMLRSADWFGVSKLILGEGSADPFGPKVVRSSAGAIFRVRIEVVSNLGDHLKRESNRKRRLFAAVKSGKLLPKDLPKQGLRGLVIGHEKRGLSRQIVEQCSATVRIGGHGRTESLNLAVAAGILLYALYY